MGRQVKSVTFNQDEGHLLHYVTSQGDFSPVVKEMIHEHLKGNGLTALMSDLIQTVNELKKEVQELKQMPRHQAVRSNETEVLTKERDFSGLDDF